MHKWYAAAIWLSIATILVGLSLLISVWGVVAIALAVGLAAAALYAGRRAL